MGEWGVANMPKNTEAIRFTRITESGESFEECILPGFAEVHESGLVISFVLMNSGSVFGEAFFLDDRVGRAEERVRKVGVWVGAHLATLQEGKFYRERMGEELNPAAITALTQLNRKLISWVDARIPRITESHLGYFDTRGRLRLEGTLHDPSHQNFQGG
ncbi:hypothetical protein [Streptomyces alkaliphilus]|uniref:hypothetical protein n=1 Tax=Streptomyces alkaliphilus TaxID=1472722 RepID=UPI00156734EA|nr:hypothetical protein [Streptomyces alkaliphilus]